MLNHLPVCLDVSPVPDRWSTRDNFPIFVENRAGKLLILNFKAEVFPCAQYRNPDIKSLSAQVIEVQAGNLAVLKALSNKYPPHPKPE